MADGKKVYVAFYQNYGDIEMIGVSETFEGAKRRSSWRCDYNAKWEYIGALKQWCAPAQGDDGFIVIEEADLWEYNSQTSAIQEV